MSEEFSVDELLNPVIIYIHREYFFHYTFSNSTDAFIENILKNHSTDFKNYFSRHKDDLEKQDNIFNQLSFVWSFLVENKRYMEGCDFWRYILSIVNEWEKENHSRVHKGSIYYWWGGTELLQGNIDAGYLLINQAVEEDAITHKIKNPDTPAFKTLTLRFDDSNQYWYPIVIEYGKYLQQRLLNYSTDPTYNLDWLIKKFLIKPEYLELSVLLSKTTASLYILDNAYLPPLNSIYTSQNLISVIQQLILIVDNFYKITHSIHNDMDFDKICKSYIKDVSGKNDGQMQPEFSYVCECSNRDLSNTLESIILNKFVFTNGLSISKDEKYVYLLYKLRNYSAHDITKSDLVIKYDQQIKQAAFNLLFGFIKIYSK
ncbi:MAG TPA: hypothetical protein DIW44_05495 [Anaerolineaceae bacterium]|nr:hypothetical protein [Anaerolineaceae bacterium]